MKKILAVLCFSILFINPIKINAATSTIEAKIDNIIGEDIDYNMVNIKISAIEKNILTNKEISKDTLGGYIKSLNEIQQQISGARDQIDSNLQSVERRLAAIGEKPTDGRKESATISQQRKEFKEEENLLRSKLVESDIILTKIDEIDQMILSTRNKILFNNIFDKQDPLIYPKNFFESNLLFLDYFYSLLKSPMNWYSNLKDEEKQDVKDKTIYIIPILLATIVVGAFIGIFIRRKFGYKKEIENPNYTVKFLAALAVFIASGLIPSAIVGFFLIFIRHVDMIIISNFGIALKNILLYSLYMFLSIAVVDAVFACENSKWRLISIDDSKVKPLKISLLVSIILIFITSLIKNIAVEIQYSSDVIFFIKMLSSGAKAISTLMIVMALLHTPEKKDEEKNAGNDTDDDLTNSETGVLGKVGFFVSLFAIFVFGLSLFGYINLSEYIFNRTIMSILTIASLYIADRVLLALIHQFLTLRFWVYQLKISRRSLAKVDTFFGVIVGPLFFILGIIIILDLWGASTDIMMQNIKKLLTGFNVGGIKISIISIIFGIFAFMISMYITKILRRRAMSNKLFRMNLEYGTRSSLASGIGFFGFVISALISMSVMGFSLSSLTLVAGALSFGIGLGLQNIVSNFVSGLIILFERPIKIGDWIIISGQEGIVKQINIRATELETSTKTSIIIPNASILSSSLVNLTHNNRLGRADVRVVVPYSEDVNKVMNTLMEIAKNNKTVMDKPNAPSVTLNDLSNGNLEFVLSVFIPDIMNRSAIQNSLRVDIVNRFNENNINFSSPARIIYSEEEDDSKKQVNKEEDNNKKEDK